MLISRVGQAVSNDSLVDGIWGEDPPSEVQTSLRSYVSNLRTGTGADIERSGGGYILNADPAAIDAFEFQRLTDEATRSLSVDPDGASETLREGLGLWRGFASMLVAAAAGSEWAWRALVEHYSGALLGYLRLRAPGDPEDVLSETWISVASAIGSFSGEEPAFRSWLFVIAHRRAIDAARKASRRLDVVDTTDVQDVSNAELSAEDQALAGMSAEHAMELLATLTPDQQSVIALRVIADLSLEETAKIVNKRVGAVKALQRGAWKASEGNWKHPFPQRANERLRD